MKRDGGNDKQFSTTTTVLNVTYAVPYLAVAAGGATLFLQR